MKKVYISLIIIIMLSSLLTACTTPATETAEAAETAKTTAPQPAEETATALEHTPKPTPEPTPDPTPAATEWPEAYSSILEEYKMIADYNFHDKNYLWYIMDGPNSQEWLKENVPVLYEMGISWVTILSGVGLRDDRDASGYGLKDLNGDGSDELILLLKNYTVLAVISVADGKPKLLDQYWDRYKCYAIDESGLLYIHSSDGAEDWISGVYKVSNNGIELQLVAEYGMSRDGVTLEDDGYYYKVIDGKIDGEREIISEVEFDEFYEKYSVFAYWREAAEITKSALVFIPILD